ncbi:site-2 protease family protein [Haloarcula nitratireducens]|uniref:Site-2 protease family protein n=1 Tax=Haloarcula nitratireducens TaxID=2487749 RepID=A0AAW4PEL3_9EURY|nr:site-2 protease family protein [Halomicroarcula nitratireducens]MBX0296311.1 site-2 protease family protein [Halomicroarcula nitratireducens]
MVSTLTWVLAGLVAYTLLAMALKARGVVPDFIRFSGPITTIHTQRGKIILEKLARPKRFWRAWGNLGVGIALVVMAGSFLLVIFGAYQAIINPQPSALNEPRNALAIPGVNDFLPLSVAPEILLGLLLGLIVHEGGHGLFCRVEDIDIESMGLALIAVIPVGAFVEPDEDELLRSDRGSQIRMYAAGVTNNFALSLVALLLLFGPIAGSLAVVDGVPVGDSLPGSAADEAGIDSGDVITAIDGQSVSNSRELQAVLAENDRRSVDVSLDDGSTTTVERAPIVVGAVQSAPLGVGTTITAVNGTEVYTRGDLDRAARNHTVAAIQTEDGEAVTTPLGAYGRVTAGSPLEAAGAPANASIIVTSLDGQRTQSASALGEALSRTSPGDQVTVVGYVDGQRREYTVTLAERDGADSGVLTSSFRAGISGFEVNDFGIDQYPAATFLEFIGGDSENPNAERGFSFVQRVFAILILPFIGVAGGFGYNFAGFTGIAANFYTVQGPLAALGTTPVFLLANALFWTGWINLVIGQFNCVPTFPLDGGHILRATTESIVSRLPVPDRRRATTAVTVAVTVSMIAGLVLMVFGPRFFA